jgi:hypothetical protein
MHFHYGRKRRRRKRMRKWWREGTILHVYFQDCQPSHASQRVKDCPSNSTTPSFIISFF